jgi:diguanylate cyclase
VTKALEIVDRIRAMMAEGSLVPAPTTYRLCYDYLTRRDPSLVTAVDAAIASDGRLTSATLERLLREQSDQASNAGNHLLEEAQTQIDRLLKMVEAGDVATGAYGDKLRNGQAAIAEQSAAGQLLRELAAATAEMLAATRDMQTQLAESSSTISGLRDNLERVSQESRTDPLVDLANRKAFDTHLVECIQTARASGGKLAVAMCDIDHFKQINDNYGHSFGDDVLRLFATRLKEYCAEQAFPARYGGEEFIAIFPNSGADGAASCLERYRAFIERAVVKKRGTQESVKFTFSVGISNLLADDQPETLVERADKALYRAKHEGRNRICIG